MPNAEVQRPAPQRTIEVLDALCHIETMTDVVRVDALRPDAALIADAAARLRRGELVAFPTETVYGLGVHALDRSAVSAALRRQGTAAHRSR